MTDVLEIVTVEIDGTPWSAWSVARIRRSATDAVSEASVTLHDPGEGLSPDWEGLPARVLASGDLLVTGFVRDFSPAHTPGGRQITIAIASKTVDGVESSIVDRSGRVAEMNLVEIGNHFDAQDIGWESEETFPPEPKHQIIPGESQWQTVERLARGRNATIHDTPEGRFKVATRPADRHAGVIALGINVITASAKFTGAGRHDVVKVRGQSTIGGEATALRPEGAARDRGVKRPRPRVIIHEEEATPDRLRQRAEFETRRAAGNGTTATVKVVGWRDAEGELWTPNRLVAVRDPLVWLDGDMVIKAVGFDQDTTAAEHGTTATLELADPRALGGEDPKGASAAAYAAPDDTATFEAL